MKAKEYFKALGYDQDELNKEFAKLLTEHSNDKELTGKHHQEQAENVFEMNDEDERQLAVTIFNAWDDLCSRHEGLVVYGKWYFGAQGTGYDNDYDVFVAISTDVF